MKKDTLGFSLVEIALVLVLVGIFLRFGVGALSSLRTHSAVGETKQKQEKIRDALSTYLSNNQRLPCPNTNPVAGAESTGLENRITPPANPNAPCSNSVGTGVVNPAIGVLSYRALGLSRDDVLDGWDNFFTYQVSLNNPASPVNEGWSLNPSPPGGPVTGSITANLGSIQINTRNAAGATVVLNNPAVGQGSIAVIISHGPNGLGAYTTKGTRNTLPPVATDELDNTDGDSIFYRRQFTDVAGAGGTFDDLVRDFTAVDLLTPLIKDGALQSAMAQVREQLRTIRDTAFGQVPRAPQPCFPPANIAALLGLPPILPPTVTVDPWGQQINYFRANPGPLTTPPAPTPPAPPPGTHAFCVWSNGPNGMNDSGGAAPPSPCPAIVIDDVGLAPVTYDQLRTAYPASVCP